MFDDAVQAFLVAAAKEREYMSADPHYSKLSYVHNEILLLHVLGSQGRYRDAMSRIADLMSAKENLADRVTSEFFYRVGWFALMKTLVRFEKWDEILDGKTLPFYNQPSESLWYHWARGLAYASTSNASGARDSLQVMEQLIRSLERVVNPIPQQFQIAHSELAAYIGASTGDMKNGLAELNRSAISESLLPYTDPTLYSRPVLELLGKTALKARSSSILWKMGPHSSRLYNKDLAPTSPEQRTWGTYNFAALWISMAHCIPTYMLASGLIGAGMSWRQALGTILLGNTIVLAPILLNSHAGTKHGIPFPVFARAAYGTFGSNLPALMRALVACGWFGIQAWIGGHALHVFFRSLWAGWPSAIPGSFGGHTPTEWISFLLFWGLNIIVIYRGMDLLRKVENWAAPFVLVMTTLLVWWALDKANGLGPVLAQKGKFGSWREFWPVFVPSLTAMIGFWATLSLNMPDFTRFGRSQREQAIGQVMALPTTMTVFAAMGVIITSASAIIYGKAIWDPVELVGKFTEPAIVAISMFTVVVATLSVNIAANVVSPANDFANAFPRVITFSRGGLLAGFIGIALQPWKLLADPSGYIFDWLLGYSGGLGSIAGVLIADYWILRRSQLVVADLYREDGTYEHWRWSGIAATLLGCAAAWIGLIVPALRPLYDYAWFVGFAVSFASYLIFSNPLSLKKPRLATDYTDSTG